jgi:hypothetical protein
MGVIWSAEHVQFWALCGPWIDPSCITRQGCSFPGPSSYVYVSFRPAALPAQMVACCYSQMSHSPGHCPLLAYSLLLLMNALPDLLLRKHLHGGVSILTVGRLDPISRLRLVCLLYCPFVFGCGGVWCGMGAALTLLPICKRSNGKSLLSNAQRRRCNVHKLTRKNESHVHGHTAAGRSKQ